VNIQATFREHSVNIQGPIGWTFGEHSGNIQGTFGEHSGTNWVNIRWTFRERSGNIRWTFRNHLGDFSLSWADAREPPSQLQEAPKNKYQGWRRIQLANMST
jgi:hypothetical protein